ncbi:hypothetical protein BJ912DRAFT_1147001 [Pholiota molesta]|nr:hypothetical protein BJ912DRAFT_1147001 [Pholiota molesta]
MLHNSRHVSITGGTFSVTTAGLSAFEKLQNASAPSAFHDSSSRFDPPKCHPNTRVAVLEYLMGWIFGHNDPEALILWLYGPAGAGKSAILQTIAERCFERGAVLASFFFGRSDPSRNTFKPLVATIAYQIATTIPQIKPQIERAIEHDPHIFGKSLATQLQCLIVEPLKILAASGFSNDPSNCARLVLMDGLDECDDPLMQSMILRVLANALRDEKLPLIILIASRPEHHITRMFNSPPLAGLWRSLVLDHSYKPDDDIRLFLEDSFRDIKTTHPHRHLIPEAWPNPWDVTKLIRKSSGQFIYSSVVVKYISADVDHPPRRLEVIMARKMRLTANSFLRKRREEKHRHGMTLSVPTNQPPSRGLTYSPKDNPYALGLLYLPPILEQSSYSPELVTFIRGHATNIPFLQKTIEVIRAIHEYLDRSDRDSEEADVTQLRIKFAAMVIE